MVMKRSSPSPAGRPRHVAETLEVAEGEPSQHLVKPFSILSCKIGVFSCSSSNCSNSSPAPKIHPRQNGRAAGI